VGLTQTLEIAGQQGYRRTAAEQELAALRETIEEARRQLRAEVEQKFIRVVSSANFATEMETGLGQDLINENSTQCTRKRFDAGEDTKLDANLAEVELGRARNQIEICRRATAPSARRIGRPAATASREKFPCRQRRRSSVEAGTALYPGSTAGSGSQPGPSCARSITANRRRAIGSVLERAASLPGRHASDSEFRS
jgi:hypothetical protein